MLGDQPFNDYVWAPRDIILGAYKRASRREMVTNNLFAEYLIPQVEFMSIGTAVKYTYNLDYAQNQPAGRPSRSVGALVIE